MVVVVQLSRPIEARVKSTPRQGAILRFDRLLEDQRVGLRLCGLVEDSRGTVDRLVEKFLADAEAKVLNSQGPQPRRVSWEDRPRPHNVIKFTAVGIGGVGGASAPSAWRSLAPAPQRVRYVGLVPVFRVRRPRANRFQNNTQ